MVPHCGRSLNYNYLYKWQWLSVEGFACAETRDTSAYDFGSNAFEKWAQKKTPTEWGGGPQFIDRGCKIQKEISCSR